MSPTPAAATPVAPDTRIALAQIFAASTRNTRDGHLEWTRPVDASGEPRVRYKGTSYRPARIAYIVRHGILPQPAARAACGRPGCCHPDHVTATPPRQAPEPAPVVAEQPPAGWHDRAACQDADLNYFFPAAYTPPHINPARQWCQQCPVAAACLESALAAEGANGTSSRFGIYGGTTPGQRNAIHLARVRRAAARRRATADRRTPRAA